MSRQTCTDHCTSCGQHFHGLGAFDAHLERMNEGKNRWGALSFEYKHLGGPDVGLEPYTVAGVCELSFPILERVTIWRKPLSQWAQEKQAAARVGKADSGLPVSRRGHLEAVADVDALPLDLGQ